MINPDEILAAIDAIPPPKEYPRRYLGASEIGEECSRKLWLQFHGYIKPEVFEPRMLRLFKRGHHEEHKLECHLREIGFEIIEDCFSQKRWTSGFVSGAADGILSKDGLMYCAEYKTHSDKSFNTLKRGELAKTHPKHFAQCQINASKFDCVGTIYLAVNKNNDELFCDIVLVDPDVVAAIDAKGEFITMSDNPPDRIASKSTAFSCKFCNAKDVCFGFELPQVDCRGCTSHVKVQKFGTFRCEMVEKSNDLDARSSNNQLDTRGWCEHHSFNPYAMNDLQGWEPMEFYPKQRAVAFKKPDGTSFINGKSPFGVESKDIVI